MSFNSIRKESPAVAGLISPQAGEALVFSYLYNY